MCNCQCNTIKVTSVLIGGFFELVSSFKTNDLDNQERFRMIICTSIPAQSTLLPVYVLVNGNTYPLLDNIGNTVMSDQLRARHCYTLVFGNHPGHFTILNCLPHSAAAGSELEIE